MILSLSFYTYIFLTRINDIGTPWPTPRKYLNNSLACMKLYLTTMEEKINLINKNIGDDNYEGFSLKAVFKWLWRNKYGIRKKTIQEKMGKACAFFHLYTGKVEIKVADKDEPIFHYFPIRPTGSFLRSHLREQYMETAPCVPAPLRMKNLLIKSGPLLTSKMNAGYVIHRKINYPILSEIFRWTRLWLALLVVFTLVLNLLVAISYSEIGEIKHLIGHSGKSKKL